MDGKPSDEAASEAIQVPEPAHTRSREDTPGLSEHSTSSDDEREATELRSRVANTQGPSTNVHARWYEPLKKVWRSNVTISTPHDDCRDHFGKWSSGVLYSVN